jgi:hypothetical protein
MAKYNTRKNSKEYKDTVTRERKRIRNEKYAFLDEKENEKDLRALAREVGAILVPVVYVPASPTLAQTKITHKHVSHALVMRG